MVSAGGRHTVLLRSDGRAVAFGMNGYGQCDLPPLEEGMSYTQVSAGESHSVLLRSDGSVVACGCNDFRKCRIPSPAAGTCYISDQRPLGRDLVLQMDVLCQDDVDDVVLTCSNLAGVKVFRLTAPGSDLAREIHQPIAHEMNVQLQSLRVVLHDGQLLSSVCTNPMATVADLVVHRKVPHRKVRLR